MKICVFFQRMPWPLHSGYTLRAFHLAKELSVKHDLDLLCLGEDSAPPEVADCFQRMEILSAPSKAELPGGHILSPHRLCAPHPATGEKIRSFIRSEKYDLVLVSGWQPLVYREWIEDVPVFCDLIDDLVLTEKRAVRIKSGFERVRKVRQLILAWNYEKRYLRNLTGVSVVSQEDADETQKHTSSPVYFVPNGVDLDYYTASGESEKIGGLVFEGNMSFPPNEDAALFLGEKIMPLIWQRAPEVKLTLVGKNPTEKVKALASDARIRVTGFVDDIRPYVQGAAIFVCPLRSGAGIKNKLLQAWAMEMPIVASRMSCGGLLANNGENLIVADDESDFAEAVLALLEDSPRREALGKAGRKCVEDFYSWAVQAEKIAAAVQRSH